MIKLIETGGPYGDCTSDFVVEFDHPYTIGKFIKEIYEKDTNGAWGHVRVLNGREWWDGIDICLYRYGKWEKPCPPEYLDRVIESATCNGGWSLLNFYVTLKEVSENAGD